MSTTIANASHALAETGRYLHSRGWSLATSSNYSVVLDRDPLRLLITASGKDKSRLVPSDFVVVDAEANPIPADGLDPAGKPSAETWLHIVAAHQPGVGAVLHTHSVWGTLLSDLYHEAGAFTLDGYEMIKAFAGVSTHEHRLTVPVFENTQDIPALAQDVAARWNDANEPHMHGYLIRRHGLYTWGRDLDDARRHVEAFEFLFQVAGQGLSFAGHRPAGVDLP